MRVGVVGATGNGGTALLRTLAAEPAVKEIVGIARRHPDRDAEPYARAAWHRLDLALPARDQEQEEALLAELTAALAGCDAVVHLAWLVQPNHRRTLLRRVNVRGTARVAEAAVRAGVPHLVVASSVGAYSPVRDDRPRDESWPTAGIPTSHYSVDKAAQERVLDAYEDRLTIARLRPALMLGAAPASEIRRYFLGPLVPPALLRPGTLPVLPLPAGLRLQAVHPDDAAAAYAAVVASGAGGAFNVAAAPVLDAGDLAGILDHGRVVEVPAGLVRRALALGWRAGAVAADPGWLDMAMSVPVMDTSRVRALGWEERHTAGDAVRDLLDGLVERRGAASAPMRPARTWPADAAPPGSRFPGRGDRLPGSVDRGLLGLYLSDHLTGATAGAARARRMATAHEGTELGPELARLAEQIDSERLLVADLIEALDLRRRPYRQAAAAVAERLGRLKLNGRLTDSPMTPVLETELMRSAVVGKRGVWEVLRRLAPELGLPSELFESLTATADRQREVLGRLHEQVTDEAFRRPVDGRSSDGRPASVDPPGK